MYPSVQHIGKQWPYIFLLRFVTLNSVVLLYPLKIVSCTDFFCCVYIYFPHFMFLHLKCISFCLLSLYFVTIVKHVIISFSFIVLFRCIFGISLFLFSFSFSSKYMHNIHFFDHTFYDKKTPAHLYLCEIRIPYAAHTYDIHSSHRKM